MINRNPVEKSVPEEQQVQAGWAASAVPAVHAGEALLAYVGDQVYVTFGEIVIIPGANMPAGAQVQPVAQVVMTEGSFHKIVEMLRRSAEQIPDPRTRTEEVSR